MLERLWHYLIVPALPVKPIFIYTGFIGSALLLLLGLMTPLIIRYLPKRWVQTNQAVIPMFVWLADIAGFLWLVLFFLRYEGIAPFTMRIWVYGLLIPVVATLVVIIIRLRKDSPNIARELVLHDRFERYLPKAKVSKQRSK